MSLSDALNVNQGEYASELKSSHSSQNFGEVSCHQVERVGLFPGLALVYNGKCLNIHPELVHSALAGISIKHYYGKCELAPIEEETEYFIEEPEETFGFSLFDSRQPSLVSVDKKSTESTNNSQSFEYREDSSIDLEAKPLCAQYKINFRNSFWNLHFPELCKLTWPQKYVSAATVTEHLHEHLMNHGSFCEKYHEEKDRIELLNKELDEYGRLKVIASPRAIPPDDKVFNFKLEEERQGLTPVENVKCRIYRKNVPKPLIDKRERFSSFCNEKEVGLKEIHRSKEEFCLTIGKPVKKMSLSPSLSTSEPESPHHVYTSRGEEEGGILFYYNWALYEAEEGLQEDSVHTTMSDTEPDILQPTNTCPPLMMDDFCRAAAKADFSDLRCNPDL